MYYSFQPPYFLLGIGLFFALTSGSAFAATLKQSVQAWSDSRAANVSTQLRTGQLLVPFLGIAAGVCIFLCSGLEIFGFPAWLAYAAAIPITLFIGLLVWIQLSNMLALVEKQGFQAIDIETWQ